jgi:peptide/nickel transport system permease protein
MEFSFSTLCGGAFLFWFGFLVYAMAKGSSSLRRYILTRLVLTIPMIFILITLIFVVMRLIPGNPVASRLKPGSDPERIAALQEELGLDKPMHIQYVTYLKDVLTGNLGRSAYNNREVSDMLGEALPATIELVIPATIVMLIFGVSSGAFAAHHHKQASDYSLRILSVVIYAFPIFWLGLMLQLVFGVWLNWLPVAKRVDPEFLGIERHTNLLLLDTLLAGNFEAFANVIAHLILPTVTLSIALIGVFVRLTRVNMIEMLEEDFVTAARARGIPERRVVYRHALRNTMIPVLTLVGLQVAILMAGAILTETTFSWPGMGLLIRDGIDNRDYPAVQGAVTVFAIFVAVISLLTDVLYAFVDPRIRY